jgi:hypothetical protein
VFLALAAQWIPPDPGCVTLPSACRWLGPLCRAPDRFCSSAMISCRRVDCCDPVVPGSEELLLLGAPRRVPQHHVNLPSRRPAGTPGAVEEVVLARQAPTVLTVSAGATAVPICCQGRSWRRRYAKPLSAPSAAIHERRAPRVGDDSAVKAKGAGASPRLAQPRRGWRRERPRARRLPSQPADSASAG